MRATTHGSYLVQLVRMSLIPINVFFVREAGSLTLIDAGLRGWGQGILDAARDLGLPIARIVLTHAHADHVGSLAELRQLLPAAEIAISARDARFLAGDQTLDSSEPQSKLRGSFPTMPFAPDRLLQDGEMVGSLQVVASPGHTPGHIALLDTRDRSLIAGDALTVAGGLAVAGTLRLSFPLPAMATWHRPTALASARRLLALNPSRLAVGHGRVLEQPQAAMAMAISEAERQLAMQEPDARGA